MRIVGKISKIKGERVEFIPLDVFPENTTYFNKIKNKKIEIENNKKFREGETVVLDEDLSHQLLYRNIRKKEKLIFIYERAKYYVVLENDYIKVLIDPEKSGRVDSLFDKKKKFEWFFSDFVYMGGKPVRCGISQGISGKELYEKRLEYKIARKRFYGKGKERKFFFEKLIELNKNKLIFLFRIKWREEKEFYPFFDVKIFTGGEIYKYFPKIKKEGRMIKFPHLGYPFWAWGYMEEFGKVDGISYERGKDRLSIKPQRKNLLTFSFYYGLNYFLNRFYYKKIEGKKGEKFELKLEVKV